MIGWRGDFREASDWPLRTTPPFLSGGVVRLSKLFSLLIFLPCVLRNPMLCNFLHLHPSSPASMLVLAYRAADALTWTGRRDPD